ncbi:hypothetical protein cand_027230 [Cryptosporidium andersoni]|uniref:Transmembrane protein n=1 Tax=Cryptosporidium andersoni TaxID=117008 RepID=A0A1J4MQD4_9CRYT|nr:hypothetical protein cand_027230 [Cryptosporidium andersoni]
MEKNDSKFNSNSRSVIDKSPTEMDEGIFQEPIKEVSITILKELEMTNEVKRDYQDLSSVPLIFDKIPAMRVLTTVLSVVFLSLGIIDWLLDHAILGVTALVLSVFIFYYRCSELNRQANAIMLWVLAIMASVISWNYVSSNENKNPIFNNILNSYMIFQFILTLFITLWMLLTISTGHKIVHEIYINDEAHITQSPIYFVFTRFCLLDWHVFLMTIEFTISIIYIIQGSYVIAIIPFLSFLVSFVYTITKRRTALQVVEILTPIFIIIFIVLCMMLPWLTTPRTRFVLEIEFIMAAISKQIIGLALLIMPIQKYRIITNCDTNYYVTHVLSSNFTKTSLVKSNNDMDPYVLDSPSYLLTINEQLSSIKDNDSPLLCELQVADQEITQNDNTTPEDNEFDNHITLLEDSPILSPTAENITSRIDKQEHFSEKSI